MIVQLFSAVVFALATVISGWALGYVGWISVALYSAGGLVGFMLVYPTVLLLGLRMQPQDDAASQEMGEATV